MQKPLCWLFSLSTLIVNVVVAQTADQVCQIEVIGHNAPMTVSVGIKNGQIRWIDSAKNMETDNVGRVALKTVADRILATQSLNVDIVSGATFSSLALKKSVTDCLKQSGFDPIDWKKAKITNTDPLHYRGAVAIVGGGGAGLAAAVSALQNGATSVVIVEKLGYLGGSTNVSGGAFNAADPDRQHPQGIEDSPDKHFDQTLKGGHNVGNPDLIRTLTNNALDTLHWLESMGMTFRTKIGTATGGSGNEATIQQQRLERGTFTRSKHNWRNILGKSRFLLKPKSRI